MPSLGDHDFKWLEPIHEGFIVNQFNLLIQEIRALVERRNEFLSSPEYRSVFPDEAMRFECKSRGEDNWTVFRTRPETSGLERVVFSLMRYEHDIRIYGTGIDPEVRVWTVSNKPGEFRFELGHYEDGRRIAIVATDLRRWQVLKMVLENFLMGKIGISDLA